MYAPDVPLFGIRSMPVVDVIIQVTWHPDWSQLCATTVKPRHEEQPSNIPVFALWRLIAYCIATQLVIPGTPPPGGRPNSANNC